MNIKEKLARLDTSNRYSFTETEEDHSWIERIEIDLQIKVIREKQSFFLLKEKYYPLFGNEYQNVIENGFASNSLAKITGDNSTVPSTLKNIIFIDLETTGLSGGTGTYAFLIGLGHIELDHIVVRQYLLPDFSHEWLLLKYVNQAIQNYKHVATFNGKTFDIPLLLNRFILNRMDVELEDKHHFDLLHPARRIWKLRLPSCDLQTLEKYILGKDRVGDIPGEIIPALYFEFIRKRDACLMQDVLEHNFYDIVNLILLTVKLSNICDNPQKHLKDCRDLFSLARFYFVKGQYSEATSLLESLLEKNVVEDRDLEIKAFFLLAMIYKKIGNSEISKKHLWELLNRQYYHPSVVEELAKFYEHQDKNYKTAKEIVERGLNYLNTVQQLHDTKDVLKYLPQLKHRYNRLTRKIEKKQM